MMALTDFKVPTPFVPRTCTGVGWFVWFPSPSCPAPFDPQVQTVPSDFKAMASLAPPQIDLTLTFGLGAGAGVTVEGEEAIGDV